MNELCFKWFKQHVQIKHFYGMAESARQHYIDSAFITDCLHVLIRLEVTRNNLLLQRSRSLKTRLWNMEVSYHVVPTI